MNSPDSAATHSTTTDSTPPADAARWQFLDTLCDGVYGTDPTGACVFVNTAAVAMLGYEAPADLLGRNMHALIHHTRADGSRYPQAECPLLASGTTGVAVRLQRETLWRRDGTSFTAEYSSFPLWDRGQIAGSVITFSDTVVRDAAARATQLATDLRGEQARLRTSEARFRTIANGIPQLSWMTDATGGIIWYNRRWYDYTGTDFASMQGWGWRQVHHPDHLDRVTEKFTASIAAGQEWEDTFPLRGSDGQYRWFLSRAVPIHDEADDAPSSGRVIGWFGTNTDITALREAEQTMEAARDEAEAANLAKSTFIANMSHELRTPLSAIIGYAEMMVEEIEDGAEPESLARDMHKIEGNARHLLGLINDVLDLSKVESGKMEAYAETFDAGVMVREVAVTVGALIDKKHNRLDLRIAPDLGTMHSDVTRIRQVLLNLLGNAAKFTEDGVITLSADRRTAPDGTDQLVFAVADTGIGMSPEQLGQLFQRFQQADASTTRQFGGTGLGLALTRAFATLLGGEIQVQSTAGVGSTFSLLLPATLPQVLQSAAEIAGEIATAATHADRQVVLVIDDDETQRDLMSRFLQREGYAARTAADGQTGLALARELRPHAILLDVTMPGMDGWSVLSVLKADPDLAQIPVVMVTFVAERALASSLGAADYVMKPVDWDRMHLVLERFRCADGTVLVVDDDEDLRARTRQVLERCGWNVVQAANGADGLRCVAAALPSLILLDLNMPVMNGFEFLRQLRATAGCGDVPVVVLTAQDLTAEDRRRLRGANQILHKGDISLRDLAETLRAMG